MIADAVKEAFRRLDIRTVRAPWPGPSGEYWEIGIRSIDDPDFQKAMNAAKIEPRSLADRTRAPGFDISKILAGVAKAKTKKENKRAADEAEKAIKRGQEENEAREEFARAEREGIVAAGFDLARYPDAVFSVKECGRLADAVAEHLVDFVRTRRDGEDPTEWDAGDIGAAFASERPVPRVVEIEDGEPEVLYMGGYPNGAALAAFVLREAVQAHKFRERLVPLASSSDSGEDSESIGS